MSRRSTGNVTELVEKARQGDARSVARLISLVEDASPLLREVMAGLAPYCKESSARMWVTADSRSETSRSSWRILYDAPAL